MTDRPTIIAKTPRHQTTVRAATNTDRPNCGLCDTGIAVAITEGKRTNVGLCIRCLRAVQNYEG